MRRALEWLGGSVLVYVLLAACAGANSGGHQAAGGGADAPDEVAAGGVPATPGAGGKEAAAAGTGGLLDPVPRAMAAGASGGGAPAQPTVKFTKVDVACSGSIKFGSSDIPAALLDIDPPSVTTALSVMHTVPAPNGDGAWLQGAAGGFVKPDGSQLGVTCSKVTDVVTFYLAD